MSVVWPLRGSFVETDPGTAYFIFHFLNFKEENRIRPQHIVSREKGGGGGYSGRDEGAQSQMGS